MGVFARGSPRRGPTRRNRADRAGSVCGQLSLARAGPAYFFFRRTSTGEAEEFPLGGVTTSFMGTGIK